MLESLYSCDMYSQAFRATSRMPYAQLSPAGLFTPSVTTIPTTHSMQGRELQLDYGIKRFRKVEYSRFDMFRARYQQSECGSRTESPGLFRGRHTIATGSNKGTRTSSTSADKQASQKRALPSFSTIETSRRARSDLRNMRRFL